MKQTHLTVTVLTLALIVLSGCAATVHKPTDLKPIVVGKDAAKNIVLNMSGSKDSTASSDWEPFKELWRQALKEDAVILGASFAAQEGDAKSTGEPGTLLVVDIADFRYLSAGMRYGFGIMTGNAFVRAHISFRDLQSGDMWGERDYDTTSTAWEGIFSAMTEKQVRAICQQIITDLSGH